jgi:cellulose synthase/poly-beta-1,6-N-acetylglucosamine synthase-like glycosyltransferase
MIMLWIALGFSVMYLMLQAFYFFQWHKTQIVSLPQDEKPSDAVTVVIVAHNEEKTIGTCLQGILQQNYPVDLVEIIVIDDHSTDATAQEVMRLGNERIQLYTLKDFPACIHAPAFKKSGITLAVDKAKSEIIVVTDADCTHPETWLTTVVASFQQSNAVFQTAPVLHTSGHSMIRKMQEMEQLMLMLITGAGITSRLHDMANGANMAFRKSAFLDVHGYEGNWQFASGDDMFLIEKMRVAFPDRISFAKSTLAVTYTDGKKNWKSLLSQRLRWAGKNAGLQLQNISRIWGFVGLYHVLLILCLIASVFHLISSWPFILLLCAKWMADYMLVATTAAFFRKTSILRYFVPLQFLYSYYILRLGLSMIMGKKGDWVRN